MPLRPPIVRTGGVVRQGTPVVKGRGVPQAPVEFDRDAFDALVADHGYDVKWEKSAHCPNRATGLAPRAHDINCSVCDGSGWIFFDPRTDVMVVQAARLNQQFYAQGRWDVGTVLVTARPGFALSYWDRLTLMNGIARFTELVRRQPVGGDRLKFFPCFLEYVAWVDRSGSLRVFSVDSDVSISAAGSILWQGAAPDTGSYYTVSYRFHPRYVVQEPLHQHRESPQGGVPKAFPVEVVARLDFLTRDESRDAPEVVDATPFGFR